MALDLYMVGVIVADMPAAVEFYRRLGLSLPEGSEQREHVEVAMGDLVFFLNSEQREQGFDPAWTKGSGGYRIILEFSLDTRDAVDSSYRRMTGFGYTSHLAPYDPLPGLHAAMIDDPDGNTILLSADERTGHARPAK